MKRFATTLLVALCALGWSATHAADPPAGDQSGAPPAETQGGMLSSLRQAFGENLDREQVRGHFDVGSPPDARRYYCLVDPKSGKRESNGVSGEAVKRRDGTTGIKSAVVSPLSCADAEQRGLLDTAGYKLTGKAAPPATLPVPAPAPAALPAAVAAPAAPAAASTMGPAQGAPDTPEDSERREIMGVYARFILAQNSHDSSALAELLLDSKDFVWCQEGGGAVWGYREALAAFGHAWQGSWRLDPQAQGSRVATLSPGVKLLVAPLLLTAGAARAPSAQRVRWSAVFVRTNSGWRIASIFVTPLSD
jgi:hypothetical protein